MSVLSTQIAATHINLMQITVNFDSKKTSHANNETVVKVTLKRNNDETRTITSEFILSSVTLNAQVRLSQNDQFRLTGELRYQRLDANSACIIFTGEARDPSGGQELFVGLGPIIIAAF